MIFWEIRGLYLHGINLADLYITDFLFKSQNIWYNFFLHKIKILIIHSYEGLSLQITCFIIFFVTWQYNDFLHVGQEIVIIIKQWSIQLYINCIKLYKNCPSRHWVFVLTRWSAFLCALGWFSSNAVNETVVYSHIKLRFKTTIF